jgi:acyl-coenzyme A thioesterase PaaI-like protein
MVADNEINPSVLITELKKKETKEPIASFLKMKLLELAPGHARVAMKIVPDHLNFNGMVFGGIVMALA